MPDETMVREKARAAVRDGKRPSRRPDRVWRGPGVGAIWRINDYNEWSRAGRSRPIQGGSDIGQTDLTAVIQAKIAAGLLPRDRPKMVWVGRGSGKACDGCEQVITRQHREISFDPPSSAVTRLHYDCMQLWDIERTKKGAGTNIEIRGGSNGDDGATLGERVDALVRARQPFANCIPCLAGVLRASAKLVRDSAQLLSFRMPPH